MAATLAFAIWVQEEGSRLPGFPTQPVDWKSVDWKIWLLGMPVISASHLYTHTQTQPLTTQVTCSQMWPSTWLDTSTLLKGSLRWRSRCAMWRTSSVMRGFTWRSMPAHMERETDSPGEWCGSTVWTPFLQPLRFYLNNSSRSKYTHLWVRHYSTSVTVSGPSERYVRITQYILIPTLKNNH